MGAIREPSRTDWAVAGQHAPFVDRLRAAARQVLSGEAEFPTLDEARQHHRSATEAADAEAIALWARVIWRLLSAYEEHQWLFERVGPVSREPRGTYVVDAGGRVHFRRFGSDGSGR